VDREISVTAAMLVTPMIGPRRYIHNDITIFALIGRFADNSRDKEQSTAQYHGDTARQTIGSRLGRNDKILSRRRHDNCASMCTRCTYYVVHIIIYILYIYIYIYICLYTRTYTYACGTWKRDNTLIREIPAAPYAINRLDSRWTDGSVDGWRETGAIPRLCKRKDNRQSDDPFFKARSAN